RGGAANAGLFVTQDEGGRAEAGERDGRKKNRHRLARLLICPNVIRTVVASGDATRYIVSCYVTGHRRWIRIGGCQGGSSASESAGRSQPIGGHFQVSHS